MLNNHVLMFSFNSRTGHVQPCNPALLAGWHEYMFIGEIKPNGYPQDGLASYIDLPAAWALTTFIVVPAPAHPLYPQSDLRTRFSVEEFGPGKIIRITKSSDRKTGGAVKPRLSLTFQKSHSQCFNPLHGCGEGGG